MIMRLICTLALLLPIVFGPSPATCGEWQVLPTAKERHFLFADFKHDDGGRLIVMCAKETRLISISFIEPRAKWKPDESITIAARSEMAHVSGDGLVIGPTQIMILQKIDTLTGLAIGPTQLTPNASNWDLLIMVMGVAKDSFTVSARGFIRTFPTANLRKAIEPILQACGHEWSTFVGGPGAPVFDPKTTAPPPSQLANKFLMLLTWRTQPTTNYQVTFDSLESCESARLQVIGDAERMRQELRHDPDPELGRLQSMQILVSALCLVPRR